MSPTKAERDMVDRLQMAARPSTAIEAPMRPNI